MKSKTGADIFEAVDYILDKADIFNRYGVDFYLSGTGLAVDPKYCGKGDLRLLSTTNTNRLLIRNRNRNDKSQIANARVPRLKRLIDRFLIDWRTKGGTQSRLRNGLRDKVGEESCRLITRFDQFQFIRSYDELAKLSPDWNFCGTATERYIQMSMTTPLLLNSR